METFIPGLGENILSLTESLRGLLYVICVAGFMLHVQRGRNDPESLFRPFIRATCVIACIALLPQGFGAVEKTLLAVANVVNEGYTEHPMRTAEKMRASVADTGEFSLRRLGESLHKAVLWAAAKLVVLVGSLLQVPFLVLQHVLKWLCYLFLPVAIALYMIPTLASLATRYVQQTLAVLAWPIGFAVTELVAYHLLTAYEANLAVAYGLAPGEIDAASFASLLGGLLAALWMIIGTLGTPFLMQMLFCSGAPMSGGGQSALQQLYMIQQAAWMIKSLKTAGAAAPVAAASATSRSGDGGSLPPPPPVAPSPPPAPRLDAGGDQQAAAALAQTSLPTPKTTI